MTGGFPNNAAASFLNPENTNLSVTINDVTKTKSKFKMDHILPVVVLTNIFRFLRENIIRHRLTP